MYIQHETCTYIHTREKLKYYYIGTHMTTRDIFCQDLKEYLNNGVEVAKRRNRCCVSILLKKMLRKEGRRRLHVQYATMLKKLFYKYMFARGMYIIPLEDAEGILANLDQLCNTLKNEEKTEEQKQPKEKMVSISFHLPKKMLEEIDNYAEINNTTRSATVRKAVEEMLKKYRNI
jgi:hypothetical protein